MASVTDSVTSEVSATYYEQELRPENKTDDTSGKEMDMNLGTREMARARRFMWDRTILDM